MFLLHLCDTWEEGACATDLDDINTLNRLCFGQAPMNPHFFSRYIAKNPFVFIAVARRKDNKRIVAKWQITLAPLDCGICKAYVDQVATHPDYEGNGLAKNLWSKVLLPFLERNHVKDVEHKDGGVNLTSSNPGAQKLYEKLGFCERATKCFRFDAACKTEAKKKLS